MNIIEKRFLEALKASLRNETLYWTDVSASELQQLFQLADEQGVVPMIYQAVQTCQATKEHEALMHKWSNIVLKRVARQLIKTKDFLQLYQILCEKGMKPLVVKGMVCRNLYPIPEQRASLDEDLVIRPEEFEICHRELLDFGMHLPKQNVDIAKADDVAYWKTNSKLYIEAHRNLFPSDSEAYGEINQLFEGMHERAIEMQIQGITVYSLEPTDHMFYLICHALKHFLGQGLGIRPVCDMLMFAKAYGKQFDWQKLMNQCKQINVEKLAATMFAIGEKYLGFDVTAIGVPEEWMACKEDEAELLEDMLGGGVLGNANMSHIHSATITLNAVIAHKRGKKAKGTLWKSVFPSTSYMKRDYGYLNKHPYLLPIAWVSRIFKYGLKINKHNAPTESIKIGNRRVGLLKKYGVLK